MPIDYKKYPANWKDVIRPRILKRDHYQCKWCGLSHRIEGYREANGRFVECDEFMAGWARRSGKRVFMIILTVAHLDQDRTNNEDENLAALCQKCHLNHDRPFNIIKRRERREIKERKKREKEDRR